MSKVEWKALYNDGNALSQYNGGEENKYTDIDRNRLDRFILFKDDIPKVVVHLNGGKRLIYRQRVAVAFSGKNAGNHETVHLVGWQEKRQGINMQMICFLFEDGHIEIEDRFYDAHPWFYPVIFLHEEEKGGEKEKNEIPKNKN